MVRGVRLWVVLQGPGSLPLRACHPPGVGLVCRIQGLSIFQPQKEDEDLGKCVLDVRMPHLEVAPAHFISAVSQQEFSHGPQRAAGKAGKCSH